MISLLKCKFIPSDHPSLKSNQCVFGNERWYSYKLEVSFQPIQPEKFSESARGLFIIILVLFLAISLSCSQGSLSKIRPRLRSQSDCEFAMIDSRSLGYSVLIT